MMGISSVLLLLGTLSTTEAVSDRKTAQAHILKAKETPLTSFLGWVDHHGKAYADDEETSMRFEIWKDNLEYVHNYNENHSTHWLEMNEFADLLNEEYRERLGYKYADKLSTTEDLSLGTFKYSDVDVSSLPDEVNWQEKGAVTDVKNQGQCGSCWAFSVTGSVEAINAIYSGKLQAVSEEELVDCDHKSYGEDPPDAGCNGGFMDNAYDFIKTNGGIDTEGDYPYTAKDGVCNKARKDRDVVTIDGYEDVPSKDQTAMLKAVAHQPVSVAVDAGHKSFQMYSGGVLDSTCGTMLNHGVLVAGYGVENGTEYWLVKNSWGNAWGDKGYLKMMRDDTKGPGQCGIAMMPSYPVKNHDNPPRPPKPGPMPPPPMEKCDASFSCPAATTCCCSKEKMLTGKCSEWGCCPTFQGTCCNDHIHCCPNFLPICDVVNNRCKPKEDGFSMGTPMLEKFPAQRVAGRNDYILKVE